jgi:hypothetical protein
MMCYSIGDLCTLHLIFNQLGSSLEHACGGNVGESVSLEVSYNPKIIIFPSPSLWDTHTKLKLFFLGICVNFEFCAKSGNWLRGCSNHPPPGQSRFSHNLLMVSLF